MQKRAKQSQLYCLKREVTERSNVVFVQLIAFHAAYIQMGWESPDKLCVFAYQKYNRISTVFCDWEDRFAYPNITDILVNNL